MQDTAPWCLRSNPIGEGESHAIRVPLVHGRDSSHRGGRIRLGAGVQRAAPAAGSRRRGPRRRAPTDPHRSRCARPRSQRTGRRPCAHHRSERPRRRARRGRDRPGPRAGDRGPYDDHPPHHQEHRKAARRKAGGEAPDGSDRILRSDAGRGECRGREHGARQQQRARPRRPRSR